MARIHGAQIIIIYLRNLSLVVAILSLVSRIVHHLGPWRKTTHETAALLSRPSPIIIHEVTTSEVFDLPADVLSSVSSPTLVQRQSSLIRTQSFRRAYVASAPTPSPVVRNWRQRALHYSVRICKNALENCVTTLATILLTGAMLGVYQSLQGIEPQVDFATFVRQQVHRLIR
ncbi:hypothetical protein SPRG_12706 [Saprolegnia parasitica CBS 223.65]|uniref:Uncharacterized protein n=1 Tax=Saprolegnia parasitica (strain CBS 223.65) TaxID=695850 RepID=A0A067C799_SAPPC|nr:hypothetical protein SPRG_12706 [Saprolegnia parasitica CBS 223.65]KDO22426.1 hypothetical protein SPRG_12706 [Saprolegnia parasitica CBS 223.65]|eukprot:XP_012206815.1 hypothetical protein SPRG_12706 [Saprolegnia parasitica CBS 223.65]